MTPVAAEGISSNPVLFNNGEPLPSDSRLSEHHPQNLWASIELAQRWAAHNILHLDTPNAYVQPSDISEIGAVDEADARRGDESARFTDQRGLESFCALFGLTSISVAQAEFRDRTVIDIGSGAGVLSDDLRQSGAAYVTEVDFSADILAGLPPIFENRGARLVSDGTRLEMIDAAAERVVSMYSTTIHTRTVEGRLRAICEAIRVTGPGGRAFLAPLLGGMVVRQQRWFDLQRNKGNPSFYDADMQAYERQLQQEAAMDFAAINLLRQLVAVGRISLTPILTREQNEHGTYDIISAMLDVHDPLTRSEVEEVIAPHVAQFTPRTD